MDKPSNFRVIIPCLHVVETVIVRLHPIGPDVLEGVGQAAGGPDHLPIGIVGVGLEQILRRVGNGYDAAALVAVIDLPGACRIEAIK